ncbi:MAG: GAF domain-containing protein [Actinobacteria bacterium]|nr:GAF domain-containing protein [Actinomycetota bacterium]
MRRRRRGRRRRADVSSAVSPPPADGDDTAALRRPDDTAALRRPDDTAALRRRAGELAALFASARELAAVRDADAVLERLVERAQELLAADVAYLSEFDDGDGTLRVRQTRGVVSGALRDLVVPRGRGLVSAIAESRLPRAVRRYDSVAADRHTSGIDDAVAAEGIVSMLGVPLLSEVRVLGVLFVAMRRERTFTPDDIALLAALADHASVVLQTAAALADAELQAERARAAAAALTAHVAARDRANRVHRELVDAVLAGGGLAPVARTLAAGLEAPVVIVDADGAVRASEGDRPPDTAAPAVRAAVVRSRADGRAVRTPDAALVSAVAAGPRSFGAIVVGASARELDDVDLRTVERAGQVTALLALSEEAVAAADHRRRADLLVELMTAAPARRADVADALRRSGVDLGRLRAATAFDVDRLGRAEAARVIARELGEGALVAELDGLVLALHDAPSDAAVRRRVRAALDVPVLAVTTGGADRDPVRATADVRAAAGLARALDLTDTLVPADDLAPYAATLTSDRRALSAFLDGALGAVRGHDAERGSDLLTTLRAFVRNGASPTRTARALTFHTNTILQRLEKLDRLLEDGWREDERFFRLSTAVRLDELRDRLAGQRDG